MFVLGLILSAAAGVTLGLLGGGGSILTVPILLYVFHLEPKTAIATSMVVVWTTSLVGLTLHARTGTVRWRAGLEFGGVAMVSAYGAGRLAGFIPDVVLLLLFAALMAVTALAMLRRPALRQAAPTMAPSHASARTMLQGLAVGAMTGLVGAGGGFLIVPALVLLGGMEMRRAIGTSLLVIALNSAAGFAGYFSHTPVDWLLAASVAATAALGSVAGALLSWRIPGATLRRAFGLLVVAMAAFILYRQLPGDSLAKLSGQYWGLLVAAMAFAVVMLWLSIRPGRARQPLSEADGEPLPRC